MLTFKDKISQVLAGVLACLILFAMIVMLGEDSGFVVIFALLPVALLAFYRNTFMLCLLFIIFSFFRIHEAYRFLEPFRIPSLLAMSCLLILAWKIGVERSIQPYWRRELKAFIVFFTITSLGCFLAVNRELAFNYWNATYVKIAIMVVAIAWLARTPKDFATASIMFVLAGIAIGYVAIYNKINEIGLVEGTRVTVARDIKSVLGDPNDLSLVLLFPMSFAMSMVVMRTSKLSAYFGAFGTIVIFYAIICTQSRGGLLGILSVGGIVGMKVIKSKVALMCIGGVAALGLVAMAGISSRASGGADETGIGESGMGRIYAWQAAMNMAIARPLTGMGLDNFTANYFYYSPHWDGLNHAVHSTWFGVLGETGFPGIISFFFMMFVIGRSAYLTDKDLSLLNAPIACRSASLATLAGFTGFCVSASFLTQGFSWPLYIILAMTIALAKYCDNLKKNIAI
jgi:putative inorganic carbon (hco3(-)) transporter